MENILNRELIVGKSACRAIGVTAFIMLTAAGAFVRIPLGFTPVPLTLQTFFVLLSGAFLGGGWGAFSQAGYILMGVAGIPVFTVAGSGLLYLSGPTAGYLLGFVLASLFVGVSIKYVKGSLKKTIAVFLAADALILICGALWLKAVFAQPLPMAVSLGLIPFVAGDVLKAVAAALVYNRLYGRIREIF